MKLLAISAIWEKVEIKYAIENGLVQPCPGNNFCKDVSTANIPMQVESIEFESKRRGFNAACSDAGNKLKFEGERKIWYFREFGSENVFNCLRNSAIQMKRG